MGASAKTSADLDRIERDIKRAEAELLRRGIAAVANGEATCLRAVVHEGEDEGEVCARVRAEAGLPEDRECFFIVRKIVPITDEFLQQQARQKAESDAIRDARNAAEDEWRPPPRVTIPDQLQPVAVSVIIDDDERVPDTIAAWFIISEGMLVLTDQAGRPLSGGSYARALAEGDRPERVARRLLLGWDAERGRGSSSVGKYR
jgi:hypothetical protein